MKVLYIAMALALSCVVPAHSMSMQELQNTSRFEMLHGFGESGNGDGTFIDKESINLNKRIQEFHLLLLILKCSM